jgi:hypothetical protein
MSAMPGSRRIFSLVASLLLGAAFFAKAAVFDGFSDVQGYYLYHLFYFDERELGLFLWFAATLLPAALLLAVFLERNGSGAALARFFYEAEESDTRLSLVLAGVVTLLVFAQAATTLGFTPITDDERTYIFMTEMLARGRTSYPLPPSPLVEALNPLFMNFDNGHWTALYLWGYPAFLLPGTLLGVPQLMNAIAAGLTTLCTFHVVKLLFDSRTARLATVLLAISPLFIFSSATLLSQPAANMFFIAGVLGYLKALRGHGRRAWGWAALAGFCFGWSYYCRPASAGVVGFVVLHAGYQVLASRGAALRRLWPALLGAALPVAVFGGIQVSLGGNPFITLEETHASNVPGLGLYKVVGGVVFTPLLAASNLLDSLLKLNLWGFGWPVSLLFPGVALVFGERRVVLPLTGAALCHILLMGIYWSSGIGDISPIYHVVLVPFMAALAAHGVFRSLDYLRGTGRPELGRAVPALVLALCLIGTPIAWYLQASSLIAVTERVRAPFEMLEAEGITRDAVVFYRPPSPRPSWVLSIPINHYPFDAPVLYFFDRGRKNNLRVKSTFPGRRGYRLVQIKPGPRWALQRLWDRRIMKKGPPVLGDRLRRPYRRAYPYSTMQTEKPR